MGDVLLILHVRMVHESSTPSDFIDHSEIMMINEYLILDVTIDRRKDVELRRGRTEKELKGKVPRRQVIEESGLTVVSGVSREITVDLDEVIGNLP